MRGIVVAAFCCMLSSWPVWAQEPITPELCSASPTQAFDVVTVKPSQQSAGNTSMRTTSDELLYTGTLQRLVQAAFNLHDFQVEGGPGWFKTAAWEIHAKSDAPDPPYAQLSADQRKQVWDRHMQQIRAMLVKRFQFRCHISSKESAVYELVLSKSGSKLTKTAAAAGNQGNMSSNSNGVVARASATGLGTDRIAIFLAGPTGRLVVDKTGLTGSYDFTLNWVPDPPAGADGGGNPAAGPTIFTAVEEQLGLHLRPAKAQVPVMVVDGVEMPSEN